MADSKISALPVGTVANLTDLIAKVNDPSGTPETQQLTVALLIQYYTGVVAPVANPANVNAPATYLNTANGFYYTWNIPSAAWVVVPKIYRAILAPTSQTTLSVTVLENSLGTVTWSVADSGFGVFSWFKAVISGGFNSSKTHVLETLDSPGDGCLVGHTFIGSDLIISLANPQALVDFTWTPVEWFGLITRDWIQILVYP